jgi:hypothetical protein
MLCKMSGKRIVISAALTLVIVILMVGAAESLNEPEIIFPEITALAIGAIIAPVCAWRVSRARMLLLISLCAAVGVLLVRYLPLPLAGQITVAFFLCQVVYLYSRTTFAPLVSAMVLPVLLGTTSWVYPLAACSLTALICLVQWLLEKAAVMPAETFAPLPLPQKKDFLTAIIRTAAVFLLALPAIALGWQFIIAPPLLVVFLELSRRGCPARKQPLRVIGLVFCCALAGAGCRWLFAMQLGWPLTVAAAVAALLMVFLLYAFRLFLPPAGAMAILAMLIPESMLLWYPLQVLIGISLLTLLALRLFAGEPQPQQESICTD